MADNFNLKSFLVENKLGAYSKAAKLNESIKNPRNPQEVAAAVKAQNPNIAHSWRDVATAAQPIMVAGFEAAGLDKEKAATATRILLGGSHSTYSDFPQDLYDAVVGEVKESRHEPVDPQDPYGTGPMQGGMFEEGASSALASLNNIEGALLNLKKNVATDSTIGTESKQGLLQAFEEMMEDLQTIGYELEADDEPEHVSDYSKRRASGLGESEASEYEMDDYFNEPAPKSGLNIKGVTALWSYADKAGVDLHVIAKQSKTPDSFVQTVINKIKGFNTPKVTRLLQQYYKDQH